MAWYGVNLGTAILTLILVGCMGDAIQDKQEPVKVFNPNNLSVADCEPWSLFPKGFSANTYHLDGVTIYKCRVDNMTCYYSAPSGRLGPSLDCEG